MPTLSQAKLAQHLGITDRRVRQLVEEKILPPADEAGGYDAEFCRDRYRLYSSGNDDDWENFYRQIEDDAHEVERLMKKALQPRAKQKDLAATAQAHIALFDDLRFAMAAKGKSRPEHALVMRLIDYDERASFSRLWERTTRFIQDNPDWAA